MKKSNTRRVGILAAIGLATSLAVTAVPA
ncbi:MAG: hypothetical protein RL467_166, partial [Actinomycetota bacterium]